MDKNFQSKWTENLEIIFLVSAPRSGSTWLQSMLATHPMIYSGVETFFFVAISSFIKEIEKKREIDVGLSAYLDDEKARSMLNNLFWQVVSCLPKPENKPVFFLEKTPSHVFHAQEILYIFPKAKFIHMIRDGRMVVNSVFQASKTWGGKWATQNLEREFINWKKSVTSGREIRSLIENDNQYFEVKYENLRTDTYKYLKDIFDWLNIETDDEQIRRIVEINSIDFMREKKQYFPSISAPMTKKNFQNIFPNEFIQNGNFEIGHYGLTKDQKERCDYLGGNLLIELGYGDVTQKSSHIGHMFMPKKILSIIEIITKLLNNRVKIPKNDN